MADLGTFLADIYNPIAFCSIQHNFIFHLFCDSVIFFIDGHFYLKNLELT